MSSVRAMRDGFHAHVSTPGWADPLNHVTGITFIWVQNGKARVLTKDSTWEMVEEGAAINPSITLPSEAMEALVEALDRWQGQPSHAKTEAAVLREWLAKEQARVDEVLHVVGRPITFAGPSK